MNEYEDELENPYTVYTTSGKLYREMKLELAKTIVTIETPDEEIDMFEDSEHFISSKKPKKQPKSKINQLKETVKKKKPSVITLEGHTNDMGKENLNLPEGRVTRSQTSRRRQSNSTDCTNSNQDNGVQPRARQGRRTRKQRNNRNDQVINTEIIVIPDSPTSAPRTLLPPQDSPIVLSDSSDNELEKSSSKDLNTSLPEDYNYDMSVRVWWKFGKIEKFSIRKYQKLASIFEHYAKQENVPEQNILLMLKDVKIKPSDTPDSLQLVAGMVIEGGVCGSSLSTASTSLTVVEQVASKDGIKLRIQQKGKKEPLIMTINKTERMKVLMLKCAEQLDIPLENLKLYFDGEAINSSDTPEDLELEGGECIDLHVIE